VLKLGKSSHHIHAKYKEMRKALQKKGKLKRLKAIKHRESNIIRNINHRTTTALIRYAKKLKGGAVLEDLKHIRKTAGTRKKQRYSLNSWSFYQQQLMLEYKAKKYGAPLFYVEPQYTPKRRSCCGHTGSANRNRKLSNARNAEKSRMLMQTQVST